MSFSAPEYSQYKNIARDLVPPIDFIIFVQFILSQDVCEHFRMQFGHIEPNINLERCLMAIDAFAHPNEKHFYSFYFGKITFFY